MSKKSFSEWLEGKLMEWMVASGKLRTRGEFARWLRIHPATLSSWLNGTRNPSSKHLYAVAAKLGHEVFEYAELEIFDEDLESVIVNWYRLSELQKKNIKNLAVPLMEEK